MGSLAFPSLDAAIGQAEGFGTPDAIPTLANNPGDLVAGPFATAHGATGSITAAGGQQIATFPSVDQGTAAEDALIANNYTGGSLQDLATGWLKGSSQAAQDQYASNLSSILGVPSSTPVSQLAGSGSPSAAGVAAPITAGGILSSLTGAATNMAANATSFVLFGVPITRAAAFILGLIVIAGAIFLFKPAQQAATTVIRAGRNAAAGAAVAA